MAVLNHLIRDGYLYVLTDEHKNVTGLNHLIRDGYIYVLTDEHKNVTGLNQLTTDGYLGPGLGQAQKMW